MAVSASVLVILSLARGEGPSGLLSQLFTIVGAKPLVQWFGVQAPPLISNSSAVVEKVFLGLLCLLLLRLILEPIFHELRGYAAHGDRFLKTLSSRAPAMFWLLLLPAVQQGPATVFLQHARLTTSMVLFGHLGLAVIFIVRRPSCVGGAHRLRWNSGRVDFKFLTHLVTATLYACCAILFTPFGLLLIAFMPP